MENLDFLYKKVFCEEKHSNKICVYMYHFEIESMWLINYATAYARMLSAGTQRAVTFHTLPNKTVPKHTHTRTYTHTGVINDRMNILFLQIPYAVL